jgi:SNF2 family DNA or RNA helicase
MKYKPRVRMYAHQEAGLKALWKTKRGGAAFWEPGTGKTKLAYDYASALFQCGETSRVLVLCTVNALGVWPHQAGIHIPTSIPYSTHVPSGPISQKVTQIREIPLDEFPTRLNILILNYDAIIRRDKRWDIMAALEEYSADLVILDESQKVKNSSAKRAKACHRLGSLARYVLLLTGTPLAKNYLDLYSQLKVLNPTIWWDDSRQKVMSWTDFRNHYAIFGGRSGFELRRFINVDDLKARYRPWVTSVFKRDCLDLPSVSDVIVPIQMNQDAREAYSLFAKEGLVVWNRRLIEAPIVLTKLLRLQEMTGGFVHDEVGEKVHFQDDKMAALVSLIEDLKDAGQKVLIFARFKWEMDAIMLAIDTKLAIRGGVTSKARQLVVSQFIESDQPDAIVIQIGSGEALDGFQHVCSNAVYYSTDYSWENFGQSRGRLERSGQKSPITFYHLHMVGTVDKLVYQALRHKRDLEREVMRDPSILIAGA